MSELARSCKIKWLNRRAILKAAIIPAIIALSSSPLSFAYGETLDELKSQYEQKKANAEQAKSKIEENKRQQNEMLSQIAQVDRRLVDASAEANRLAGELEKTVAQREELERQLAEIQAQLDITIQELNEAKKKLESYKRTLSNRLKNVYINGKSTFLEVILKSSDFSSLLNRLSFLKMIASQDARLVRETQLTKSVIEEKEAEQERQKTSIEVKKAAIAAEEQRIAALKREQERRKAAAQAELTLRSSLVEKLKRDQAALEAMAAQEEADAEALAERIRSWAYISVSRTGWVWPVGTFADITSGFGPRLQPTPGASTFHRGVDIAVACGTPVLAANNGVVEDTGWFGGYGLYVGINHGDGLASAYGHLSSIAVAAGQRVKAGQVIGYVGSTGVSTGPHLHFEILVDGVQQDPMQWY